VEWLLAAASVVFGVVVHRFWLICRRPRHSPSRELRDAAKAGLERARRDQNIVRLEIELGYRERYPAPSSGPGGVSPLWRDVENAVREHRTRARMKPNYTEAGDIMTTSDGANWRIADDGTLEQL
jgi:hypothetical protein